MWRVSMLQLAIMIGLLFALVATAAATSVPMIEYGDSYGSSGKDCYKVRRLLYCAVCKTRILRYVCIYYTGLEADTAT